MIELEDLTFKEYLEKEDKYPYHYANLFSNKLNEPVDVFGFGPIHLMTFGQVKDLQYLFRKGLTWELLIQSVEMIKGIDKKEIIENKYFDLCKFMAFIRAGLDSIIRLEEHLSHEATDKDVAAGIENLSKFGIALQIDKLAHGLIWEYETVRKQKYMLGYTKLLMEKERDLYNYNFNKIKT